MTATKKPDAPARYIVVGPVVGSDYTTLSAGTEVTADQLVGDPAYLTEVGLLVPAADKKGK